MKDNPPAEITPEVMRECLYSKVLKRDQRLTRDAVKGLAMHVSWCVQGYRNPLQTPATLSGFYDELGRPAAEVLLDSLTRRAVAIKAILNLRPPGNDADVRERDYRADLNNAAEQKLKIVEGAIEAIQAVLPFLEVTPQEAVAPGWHGQAVDLAKVFTLWTSICGWNPPVGLSNDGPVVRFVVEMIPWITGETPSMGSVAKYLKRTWTDRKNLSAIPDQGQIR